MAEEERCSCSAAAAAVDMDCGMTPFAGSCQMAYCGSCRTTYHFGSEEVGGRMPGLGVVVAVMEVAEWHSDLEADHLPAD